MAKATAKTKTKRETVEEPQAPAPEAVKKNGGLFQPATKRQAKLRMALDGPSGAGKTYTALAVGSALGKRIAVIDTEHGSASKYAGEPFVFDTLILESFEPKTYVDAIRAAEAEGYDVLIIDSLSHAWAGKGGALEQVDRRAEGLKGNKFVAWRFVTPQHNALVDAILSAKLHVIATMRTKTEYAVEKEGDRTSVRKLGLAPVQRDGIEYEFDVVGDLDLEHNLHVGKTRCAVLDNVVMAKPGADLAAMLDGWLGHGAPALPAPAPPAPAPAPAAQRARPAAQPATAPPPGPPPAPAAPPTAEDLAKKLLAQVATALGNSLAPQWSKERYAEAFAAMGQNRLKLIGLLVELHQAQHGGCEHILSIPSAVDYVYPGTDEERAYTDTVRGQLYITATGPAPATTDPAYNDDEIPF